MARLLYLTLLLGLGAAGAARAETVLSPQFVVDRILSEGRDAKRIELDAQSAYTNYYNLIGRYDLGVTGKVNYEDSRIRYLSGSGNLRDRTTTWDLGVAKRLPTGTSFGLDYSRQSQDSILRATTANIFGRTPYVVYDVGTLTVTQDLLGNFLGVAEREQNRAAEIDLQSADLNARERKEGLVLDTLRLYWNAYVAQETLREANAQKEKYAQLVKEITEKTRLAFVMPADLPKARAEYGAQVRNVKAAAYEYVKSLELLLAAIRMQEGPRDVRFDVGQELPPVPTMVMSDVDEKRPVRVATMGNESASLSLRAAERTNNIPEVRLVGVAAVTGLGATGSGALNEVTGSKAPRYGIGLEVGYKFGSDAYRGALNQARVASDIAYNALQKTREDLRQEISTTMEQVRFTYAAAVSAIDEQEQWEKAVSAQEKTFRQGRVDFSQLILDYDSYYKARAERIKAIGDYRNAVNAYSAAVDELLR